jgi:lysyl-tRNA synthetase class 2
MQITMENDLIRERLKKLEALKALGVEPYGHRFEGAVRLGEVLASFGEGKKVRTAGRITALRSHGKTSFLDLRDSTGKLQVYVKAEDLTERERKVFELLDIGDILGVEGELFKTKTGQETVKAAQIELLAKALRPLPEKWHGLKDVETRYRHRYLDLATNDEVVKIFRLRSRVIAEVRAYLDRLGYLEVETPMMHPIPGGAAGKPFLTHHEALDIDLYLRVAPELYLKKLLVGGFEKVYEVNKSFRNEGISTRHNPEFTMLEVYTAYHDASDVMDLTEALIRHAAQAVLGKLQIETPAGTLDLGGRWERVSFAALMKERFGILPEEPEKEWVHKLRKKGVRIEGEELSRTQIINIVGEALEPGKEAGRKGRPVFVTEYFTELCPLAKKNKANPFVSERFELYVGGLEVANGYSELNDPLEQRERLTDELEAAGRKPGPDTLDEDFLLALEHGMPPAGGLGVGIDRLVMVLAGKDSIREVILFPQMRPQARPEEGA